jgi:ketosteroid isomerase-like protein
MELERPEIVALFYSALISPNDVEQLFEFLSPRVEWILSAADPQTLGEESPSNAIKFSGTEGFRQLTLYFRDSLHVISGDLTGCITHHHLVFAFGRVRLRPPGTGQVAETNLAARITFQGSKIIRCQIRISWPLAFET